MCNLMLMTLSKNPKIFESQFNSGFPPKMETLPGGYPVKAPTPKARMFLIFFSVAICMGTLFLLQTKLSKPRKTKDFYSFDVQDMRGRVVSLEKYRGKVSLVVNVASRCELTERNYRELQELHRELGTSHFNVLAFPCAQYGDTEPGTNREIEFFAKSNFGVTFPIFSKIKIMGSEADPAFKFLTDSVQKAPKWNFWKFLVNPEGKVVKFWKAEESMETIRQEAIALVREIILRKRAEL